MNDTHNAYLITFTAHVQIPWINYFTLIFVLDFHCISITIVFTVNSLLLEFPRSTTETFETTETSEEEEDSLNTDELIAAVSASAEQGIALFSQWLGLNLNPKLNLTNKNRNQESSNQRAISSTTSRSARTHWDQEEKNDERFKQLLSAQDNIQKGSATIGQSNGAETTFVYSKPPELFAAEKSTDDRRVEQMRIDPQHLVVVPKESRRGGRAYNIHQHVNEI